MERTVGRDRDQRESVNARAGLARRREVVLQLPHLRTLVITAGEDIFVDEALSRQRAEESDERIVPAIGGRRGATQQLPSYGSQEALELDIAHRCGLEQGPQQRIA